MNQKQKYNQVWRYGDVQEPETWSVWEVIKDFEGKKNLEIGPGNYPKIPIENGFFVDISDKAIENLKKMGAHAQTGDAISLPFEDELFDLVVAIEVLEHIEHDKKALSEIARTLKPSGNFLFSVPLRMDLYGERDRVVGHWRRYEIKELMDLLSGTGFKILKYRHPSFYSKIIGVLIEPLSIPKIYLKYSKNKKHASASRLSNFIFNVYTKSYAVLERKGAPQWQTDIKNFPTYKDRGVTMLCQKKQ